MVVKVVVVMMVMVVVNVMMELMAMKSDFEGEGGGEYGIGDERVDCECDGSSGGGEDGVEARDE